MFFDSDIVIADLTAKGPASPDPRLTVSLINRFNDRPTWGRPAGTLLFVGFETRRMADGPDRSTYRFREDKLGWDQAWLAGAYEAADLAALYPPGHTPRLVDGRGKVDED